MLTKTLVTAEEFEALAGQAGPCDLVRGEVIALSPGGFSHSLVIMNTAGLLWEWARRTGLGRTVTGETGLVVERQPDSVRSVRASR
jgi:Uma2 family endonuclease